MWMNDKGIFRHLKVYFFLLIEIAANNLQHSHHFKTGESISCQGRPYWISNYISAKLNVTTVNIISEISHVLNVGG